MADVLTGRRFVSGMGNVQNNTSWPIRDLAAGTYFWSVQAVDNAYNPSGWAAEATFTVSASGGVATNTESGEAPNRFQLLGGFPNPFSRQTTVQYSIADAQHVELTVFTTLGGRVVTLESGYVAGGNHRLTWDGLDSRGAEVGAGVYILQLVSDEGTRTIQLVRVKS